jgi:hypothetical protein
MLIDFAFSSPRCSSRGSNIREIRKWPCRYLATLVRGTSWRRYLKKQRSGGGGVVLHILSLWRSDVWVCLILQLTNKNVNLVRNLVGVFGWGTGTSQGVYVHRATQTRTYVCAENWTLIQGWPNRSSRATCGSLTCNVLLAEICWLSSITPIFEQVNNLK